MMTSADSTVPAPDKRLLIVSRDRDSRWLFRTRVFAARHHDDRAGGMQGLRASLTFRDDLANHTPQEIASRVHLTSARERFSLLRLLRTTHFR